MSSNSDDSGVMFKDYAEDRKKKAYLSFRYKTRARQAYWALKKYGLDGIPKILDLGSADGLTMALLHQMAGAEKSVGIEYTQELVDMATGLPDGCEIRQGDVTQLPEDCKKGDFHLVTALALLEHIGDPAKVFAQANKALLPGGLFVASCPNPFWDKLSGSVGLHKEEYHFTDFRWPLFKQFAIGEGMEAVRFKPFMSVPYAFLPYLKIPVSAAIADVIDTAILTFRIFNFTFVNQLFVARKPLV